MSERVAPALAFSWEDFMREWCMREDFRHALPKLLPGEDPEFVRYISGLAAEEAAAEGLIAASS